MKDNLKYNKKSYTAGFLLAFVFGPLGLMYGNIMMGLILFALTVLLVFIAGIFGAGLGWIVSMILSFAAVLEYNQTQKETANEEQKIALKAESERQELLEAIRQGFTPGETK